MSPTFALDLGEARVPLPGNLRAALAQATARAKLDAYAPRAGNLSLRRLLATRLQHQYGRPMRMGDVAVTHGASGALAAAIVTLTSPGDRILVPDPGYPAFRALACALGRYPVGYSAGELDPAKLVAALEIAAAGSASLMISNSPGNPTGSLASPEVCAAITRWADARGTPIVSDDLYASLVYEGAAASPFAESHSRTPVVAIGSLSKSFAVPGLRLGYAAGPEPLIEELSRAHWALHMSVSAPSQEIATLLLRTEGLLTEHIKSVLVNRRDAAVNELRTEWPTIARPAAGLFLWLDVRAATEDDRAFAFHALRDQSVALSPGSDFGERGRGFVRLCFGGETDSVVAGTRRVADLHRRLRVVA